MSITAKQLSKSGARGKDLDSVVREQLQIIDDKLQHADRIWGRNIVTHELPVMLTGIPGLDKKDAQRIVYSTILRSLNKRGFETRILLEEDQTTVYIVWTTDLDKKEVDAMNEVIRSKRIARDDVREFTSREGGISSASGAPKPVTNRAKSMEPISRTPAENALLDEQR